MIYVKQKFPCGLELEHKISGLSIFGYDYDFLCPVHKKECKRK